MSREEDNSNASPLDGIRVVEIGTFIAGPFAGQQLGDLGADVIKVEQPGVGDPMRHWHDFGEGDLWWPSIARNKRSLAMNLSKPESRDTFLTIVRQADVLLENFRPGTLEKWGLGPDVLLAENPRLVMTRVSGFGQDGPRSSEPGFGSIGEAMGGIRHLTGWPDRVSTRSGISLGDQIASLFATIGTLAALRHAEHTGVGQVVDVAIYESVFALMESLVAEYELADHVRGRTGPSLPGVVPSNAYVTGDGDEVLIAANSDAIYERLIRALELDELIGDQSLAGHVERGLHADRVDKIINTRTRELSTKELIVKLRESDVPHGKIYAAPDIATDPHFAARGAILRKTAEGISGDVAMPAPTPRLSVTPGKVRHLGPALGAHTEEILAELCGATTEDLDRLRSAGVI